jgi:RNA polymerase sigma-70 factor (ECF subfamily)
MGRGDDGSRTGSSVRALLRSPSDPGAWKVFVDRYTPRVYGWCRKWGLQDADAQDVTQNVLVKMFGKLPEFPYDPARGSFRAWLEQVTRNALRDYLGAKGRAGIGSGDSAVLGRLQTVEAREDLLRALAEVFDLELLEEAKQWVRLRLSPPNWEIFDALFFQARPPEEVAREHHKTVPAVRMVKVRGKKLLLAEIDRLGGKGAPPREED